MKYVVLSLLAVMGCLRGEDRPAREKYNEGVAALAKPDFDAAEKALLEARSSAGVDPELRFRAAYDLGLAYAAHADKVKSPAAEGGGDLAKALELEQQAAWWFGDALRLRDHSPDATANLAIVRARVQAISDELRKGEGKLEARLDALIQQQRTVLDGVRGAWREITRLAGRDPLAQQSTLVALADTSRGIVAEAGTISDLAADEIDAIGKKPEDKREAQEQARLVQLKNLDLYIGEARARIAETRRELQDLSAETALAKAEAALVALKRAREQLDDPITILQATLRDEVALDGETHQAQVAGGTNPLGGGADQPRLDKWLEYTALAGRQGGIRERVDEVRARLQSAVDAHDQPPDPKAPPKQPDPKQDKLIAQVRVALPSVVAATAAMTRVHDALLDKQWKPARDAEAEAALALFAAIEQFADLKHTIDIAWGTHQELRALLQPPTPGDELAPAERGKKVHDDLTGNVARLDRIAALIADEVTEVAEQEQALAAKPPAPAAGTGRGSADPAADAAKLDAQKAQLVQERERYGKAEELRARAKTELAALDQAIATNADAIGAAKTADATLDELRKLFFDVIEHLKELAREQGETKDRTSEANAADDFSRQDMLPAIATRQDDHGKMAKSITDALGHQADALAKQGAGPPQPGQPSPAERAKAFAGAASEVRLAHNDMSDASAVFAKSKSAAQSVSLDPATRSQATAIEHLMKALQLLQPPPKKSDQKQDDQKQDQSKDQKDQKDQAQKDQQKQAEKDKQAQQQGGAGQRARDEDARRQKEKHDRAKSSDTVDQDW